MRAFLTCIYRSFGNLIFGLGGGAGRGDIGLVTSANNFVFFFARRGSVYNISGQGPLSPFQVNLIFSRLAENERM